MMVTVTLIKMMMIVSPKRTSASQVDQIFARRCWVRNL